MSLETYIARRGAVYQLRVRLPQDLAAITASREIRFSLKTTDPAEARRLGRVGRLAMTRLFEKLRQMLANPDDAPVRYLTSKEIRNLARQFFLQEINREEIYRVNAEEFGAALEERKALRADEEKRYREALGSGRLEVVGEDSQRVLAYHGIDPDFAGNRHTVPPNMLNQLSYFLLRAKLAATRLAQAHDAGHFEAVPADPLFDDIRTADFNLSDLALVKAVMTAPAINSRQPALTERQSIPLSQLYDRIIKEKKISAKAQGDYRNSIAWLVQVIGDKPVGEVSPEHLLKFKDVLLRTPKNFTQRFKTDNILDAIKLNEMREKPLETLSLETIQNKYLSNLRAIFLWASDNHMTSNGDPADKLRVKLDKKKGSAKERLPFSMGQLQRMFETPLYIGCKKRNRLFEPGHTQVRDHRFWVPLLALFSGCRLNEIGQVELADIKMFNGMLHLFVQTQRDPEDDDDELDERFLKTGAALRMIPLHVELIQIGFLDYVAERQDDKKEKSRRLFPNWQKGSDGYYSSTFSKWFNAQFLKKHELKTQKHVFHSLRHNFKDALRAAKISHDTQNRLMGHSSGHVSEEYGSGELLEAESKEFGKIRYEGLDLTHLHLADPRTSLSRL